MPSSPTTIFSGTTGPKGDRPGPDKIATRLAMYGIAVVFFPLTTVAFLGWLTLFVYARMPWWVPAPVAAVMWFLAFQVDGGGLAGAITDHVNMWGAILAGFRSESGIGTFMVQNVGALLWAQFWFAAMVGTTAAAIVASWKWVRRPRWEERDLWPGPWLKARAKKTAEQIAAGQDSPVDGVTVGVAVDKRDPRFAGGKPGAPYGRRAVLLDSEGAGHCLVVGGSGSGKALDVTTPIPLPGGQFRAMGDLTVGDVVLDENMRPTTVIGAFDVMHGHRCFDVAFEDGSHVIADADHLWRVQERTSGQDSDHWLVVNTETLLMNTLLDWDGEPLVQVPEVTGSDGTVLHSRRGIVRIRPVVSRPVRCIAVDSPNRVFLAGEGFVPTHNTTTMLMGMRDVMRRGHGLVVVDCKGGPDVPEQVAEWAGRYGRRFYHWDMLDPRSTYTGPADGPAYYDPIGRGDPSRRKDLIIGSQRWDVEYYKTVIGDYLQTAFTVMNLVPAPDGTDTLKDISDLLSPQALMRRAAPIPRDKHPQLALALERIASMGDQERSGINNMYARLNTLTASIAGSWLRLDPDGERDIDLLRIADRGDVVVFSLDTSNYEETSGLLAGLIVQDLKTVSSALREQKASTPMHVYIDEFSAVDATNIYGLLAKARDARMPVTLATQALADLKRREAHFDSQVVGIVGSFLIHRANSEDDARIYAGLSGMTRKMLHRIGVENSTGTLSTLGAASATGSGFLEEKEMYRVDPGVFQSLKQGQCVMIAKIPDNRFIAPVQVVREDPARATTVGDGPIDPERVDRTPDFLPPDETYEALYSQPWTPDAGSGPETDRQEAVNSTGEEPISPPDVSHPVLPHPERDEEPPPSPDPANAADGAGPVRPTRPVVPKQAKAAGAPLPNFSPGQTPASPPVRRPADPRDITDEWTTL